MPLEILSTSRLVLKPLTLDQLQMYLGQDQDFIDQVGRASREILTDPLKRAIALKIEKMASALPDEIPWITYWLIQILPDRFGAGMIGFKGAPDDNGAVEIGYGIDSAYRNQGYVTEAVIGMIRWAFQDPRCKRILAPDTQRSNPASNRVLEKAGLRICQEKTDSVCWRLERDWGE